jgi:recombination protein RecA
MMAKAKRSKKGAKRRARKPRPPTPKDYLQALNSGRKKKGEREFAFFASSDIDTEIVERVPTGSLVLDEVTGGGWPVGRISECAAWEGVGKSTLLDQSIAAHQKAGGVAALVDTEQKRQVDYVEALGVDMGALISKPVDTVEDSFRVVNELLDAQEGWVRKGNARPLLIVLDSFGGTPTVAELEGGVDDAHVAGAAKVLKQNFRRVMLRVARSRTAFVVVNHFYESIGPFGGLRSYGGGAIRYFTSLRLWLARKSAALRVGTDVVGHVVECKVRKTQVHRPRAPMEAALVYGRGFDDDYTLYRWGMENGVSPQHRWVLTRGGWSYLMLPDGSHAPFQRQFLGMREAFEQHPKIREQMVAQYRGGRDGEGKEDGDGEVEAAPEGGQEADGDAGGDP